MSCSQARVRSVRGQSTRPSAATRRWPCWPWRWRFPSSPSFGSSYTTAARPASAAAARAKRNGRPRSPKRSELPATAELPSLSVLLPLQGGRVGWGCFERLWLSQGSERRARWSSGGSRLGTLAWRSWHHDLNGVSETIDREVSAIDSQDLIESGIVVHDGKHDRVDVRERLIDVLGQYVSSMSVGTST